PDDAPFAYEKEMIAKLKKAGLLVAGAAVQKLMMSLGKEQEILMNIADIIGQVYVAESALLRVEKLYHKNGENLEAVSFQKDLADVYLYETVDKVYLAGKEALNSFAEGDELAMMMVGLRRFTKASPFNVKDARQRIAKKLIEENRYSV